MQASTYVLLLAVGYRHGQAPTSITQPPGTPAVDPVVQALVLTDIVIGATVAALLLGLALQLHKRAKARSIPRNCGRCSSDRACRLPLRSRGHSRLPDCCWWSAMMLPGPCRTSSPILTASAVSGDRCLVMAMHTAGAVDLLVRRLGAAGGQVLGIGFVVDQVGAALGAFIGLLFTATLVFAWGYFDEVARAFPRSDAGVPGRP